MKSTKECIFFTTIIKSKSTCLFHVFFVKSKLRFISNLQSIKTHRLVRTRKRQIRKIFINSCLRKEFASVYFLSKSCQKNRSFRHIKYFSSLKTYFTRLFHEFFSFFIRSTCINQIANIATNESKFIKSINQKSRIIKNALIRNRDVHLSSNTLIVMFRIFH